MNRGLVMALLLLSFLIALLGAGAILIADATEEQERLLEAAYAMPEEEEALYTLFDALDRHRLLYSSFVPFRYVAEYEGALGSLRAAASTGSEDGYADAHARASVALTQIKRSARLFPKQILCIT